MNNEYSIFISLNNEMEETHRTHLWMMSLEIKNIKFSHVLNTLYYVCLMN